MARKACEWRNGRRCQLTDCPVTKADCDGCSDYKEPPEPAETVAEHLAKITSSEAAKLIVFKVNELGFTDRIALWLRSEWKEDSDEGKCMDS